MPPAKVKIEKIDGHRMRQNTFHKRKLGLIKKAIELTILCDCDCAIILRPSQTSENSSFSARDGRVVAYSNVNIQRMIQECWGDIAQQPQISNAEYSKLSKDQEAIQSVNEAAIAASKNMSKVPGNVIPGQPAVYAMMGGQDMAQHMQHQFLPQNGGEGRGKGDKMPALQGGAPQSFNTLAANFAQWDVSHNAQLLALNQQQNLMQQGAGVHKNQQQMMGVGGAPQLHPAWQFGGLGAMDGALGRSQGMPLGLGQHGGGVGGQQQGQQGQQQHQQQPYQSNPPSHSAEGGNGVNGSGGGGGVNGGGGVKSDSGAGATPQGGGVDYSKMVEQQQKQHHQQMASMFFQPIPPQDPVNAVHPIPPQGIKHHDSHYPPPCTHFCTGPSRPKIRGDGTPTATSDASHSP